MYALDKNNNLLNDEWETHKSKKPPMIFIVILFSFHKIRKYERQITYLD
jgi:hypothetical protein